MNKYFFLLYFVFFSLCHLLFGNSELEKNREWDKLKFSEKKEFLNQPELVQYVLKNYFQYYDSNLNKKNESPYQDMRLMIRARQKNLRLDQTRKINLIKNVSSFESLEQNQENEKMLIKEKFKNDIKTQNLKLQELEKNVKRVSDFMHEWGEDSLALYSMIVHFEAYQNYYPRLAKMVLDLNPQIYSDYLSQKDLDLDLGLADAESDCLQQQEALSSNDSPTGYLTQIMSGFFNEVLFFFR
jgi:hypothetical protein